MIEKNDDLLNAEESVKASSNNDQNAAVEQEAMTDNNIENDIEDEDNDEEDNKKPFHLLIPLIGIIALIAVVVIIILRINVWNKGIAYVIPPDTVVKLDTSDNVVLMPPSVMSPDTDDGVTTVLLLGNGSYYEGKENGTDIVSMFSEDFPEEVKIIDCTIPLTYLTSYKIYETSPEECPEDYFTLFWLSASVCWNDYERQYTALKYLDGEKFDLKRHKEVVDTLASIDVSDIDVVMYCYDGYDYQTGRVAMAVSESGSPITENVTTLLGAVYTSIDLFSTYNPQIQYVYVFPSFCYAFDENGNKQSCNTYDTSNGTIAATFNAARQVSNYYTVSYSYVDMYTGVDINEENADKYLESDGRTPNEKGRRMIADRLSLLLKDRLYTKEKSIK